MAADLTTEPAPPDTLLVRRLPECLTERDLNELFTHFGAQEVRKETARGKLRNLAAFVKFQSNEDASYAMNRLHQLVIMGKRLVVEYADFTFAPKSKQTEPVDCNTHLEWNYPPANELIVKNIAAMLLNNSQFYVRVIELMKSFNLPPPFSTVGIEEQIVDNLSEINEVEMEELYKEETEESELECDDSFSTKEIIPELPSKHKRTKRLKKTVKLVAVQQSYIKSKSTTELAEVFDRPDLSINKKLSVRIPAELPPEEKEEMVSVSTEGFGTFTPAPVTGQNSTAESTEGQDGNDESSEFISKLKLSTNSITPEEMKLLPVFKNYSKGDPNSRLYVKNIAKNSKEEDLKYIYGRYVVWTSEEEKNMFDIRLMTEGRMKGQAFVTLPSVKRAEQALSETNGFILNGKPLVVQFARSAQLKTQTNLT